LQRSWLSLGVSGELPSGNSTDCGNAEPAELCSEWIDLPAGSFQERGRTSTRRSSWLTA